MGKLYNFWNSRGKSGKVMFVLIGFLLLCALHGALVNAGLLQAPPAIQPASRTAISSSPAAAEPFDVQAPRAAVVVHSYLRQTLNDWSSYEDMGLSEPVVIEHKGRNVYHVLHRYRAKNQLGALRLVEQDFYYTHGGDIVDVSEAR